MALIEVKCPCCEATLKIDTQLQAVLYHEQPVKPAPIEDLAAAVAKMKGEEGRREEVFQKSVQHERNSKDVLNRKFDELFKQAKEDPNFGKKPREIDLD